MKTWEKTGPPRRRNLKILKGNRVIYVFLIKIVKRGIMGAVCP